MPSTYSPDLRIELIGTGDQAGVWGSTTNNNLTYVLEQSIAGYVSVSVTSANQALTYLNGASAIAADNQSVHSALALTTTTGANFAVYAPPASKQYTIYNASAYTATIYNSTVIGNTTAAGTGVAIPSLKTMTVWSDGTNFTQQNTHLISPTIASPTLTAPVLGTPASGTMTNVTGLPLTTAVTGILPTGNGGTGTTSTTGTGANVFATSPTLVTPVLGTPSSGNLSNCTGVSLTAGVSGTLPVANGGTGVTASTGSGTRFVLDTSPTLVTPILGTPQSGNFSSGSFTWPTFNQNTTGTAAGLSATLAIASGGTGQTTRQAAMDALAGSVTSGQYLRGNGTDVVMSAIQVSDVPTLNQNTTGSSGSCTGNAATATTAANGGVTSVDSATGGVTLANLTAFARSLSTNGYQKFPGGLIIQWGTVPNAGVTYVLTTFPIAFPSTCLGVVSNPNRTTMANYAPATGWNTTEFYCPTDGADTFWVAFGY